ncbi:MAG: DLW-39 family protein [Actinomycetota bacterium]|jgi:hypothetical protein|nr:DLW-39 family protein [Actinomycetota bacterium]
MKKLLLLAAAVVGAYVAFARVKSGQAEQDLWSEATDRVQPNR